ncbi:CAP domain-containing protein [Cryptosporangium sp. NPDC051539]|uniref:CAP domain-containing protein n=1 Tax=Cryptosporangium sp. NPDC051539 TaxID=3363962 RepID=UPI0037ACFE6F
MSGSTYPSRPNSRPDLYSGARRRFSGLGTIASGFVALVLVLGALLTSELDRYSTQDDPPPNAQTPGSPLLPAAPVDPGNASPAPGGTPPDDPPPSASPPADSVPIAILTAINQELSGQGCKPVKLDPKLVTAARNHMNTMVATGYLDLRTPDGTGPAGRAKAAGFGGSRVVESVVLGAEAAQDAATIGFPSPGKSGDAVPITVQIVSRTTLMCGYTSLGADFRRDSRNVPIWSMVLGTK